MGQETENTNPVINGNKYDSLFCHGLAIVYRYCRSPAGKATAIYPNKNRPLIAFMCFGPNIKVKAILAYRLFRDKKLRRVNRKRDRFPLHWAWAEILTFFYTAPGLYGLRRFPAQFSYRRCSEWNRSEE